MHSEAGYRCLEGNERTVKGREKWKLVDHRVHC